MPHIRGGLPNMDSPDTPIRLIVADIDGTLLDDDGNLPPLNLRALESCRKNGIKVCLATGRRWTTCKRLLDRLDLYAYIDFIILNNGMVIRDMRNAREVHRTIFPEEKVLAAINALNAEGLDPIALIHEDGDGVKDVFHRNDSLLNSDFIAKNAIHVEKITDWRAGLAGLKVVELLMVGAERDLQAAEALVRPVELETSILKNSFYVEYMLEITPMGINKLTGAGRLLRHLGLTEEEALVIGDSGNDLEMIRHMPVSVAMENGCAPVKAAARHIAPSNCEGGFGQALFNLALKGKVP